MSTVTIDISQVIKLCIYALEHDNVSGALGLLRDASAAIEGKEADEKEPMMTPD